MSISQIRNLVLTNLIGRFNTKKRWCYYVPTNQTTSGQWVGCVAVDNGGDWMVCGGSMAPSVFRLTSTNKIAALSVPANVVSQTAIFTQDRVSPSHHLQS